MTAGAAELEAGRETALLRFLRGGDAQLVHLTVWLSVLVLGFLFIYPMIVALLRAGSDIPVSGAALFSGNIGAALPNVLKNTVIVVVGGAVIGLVVGTLIAWVNERTDVDLGLFGELLPLSSLLLPPIAGVIGWAVLLDPRAGLANHFFQWLFGLVGITIESGPFNIYTMSGLVIMMGLYKVPYVFLVVSAALRRIDPAIEEASRVSAAGPVKTLFRITLPGIRPALAAAALLAVITGISQFSVPLVLGGGARVDVLAVFIYRLLSTFPPQTAAALMMALGMVIVVQLLLIVQRWVAPEGRNASIGGRGFRNARVALGIWRRPVKGLVIAYLAITALLPIAGLVLVSLQRFWTPIINWSQLSFANFIEVVINNRLTSRGLTNSVFLGVITATICMLLAGLIILHFHQSRRFGRRFADGVMSLPATMPHTVIGVAFLLAFSVAPFRLYGTSLLLLLAYIVMALPFASRAAASAASSIGNELAEASRVFGASETRTFRKILFPLALPGLIAGWIIVFIHTVGEVTASALLAGTGNPAIGRVLMELWTFASFPQVAALALVITVISATLVGVMLIISRRSLSVTVS